MFVRKKGNTLIISLLLVVALVFSGIAVVFGAADGNGSGYKGGTLGGCSGSNCIWSGRTGIRLSLVDADGNKVAGTTHIDLWIWEKLTVIKDYDLWDDKGNRLWDFSGAWYGNQIKQEVFSNPAGLQFGDYFALDNVYDMETVLNHNFISVYDRWDCSWVQKIADWLIDITNNNNTDTMDNVLKKLGYKVDGETSPSVVAANSGYYLQYEPLIVQGRMGSDITNYIFVGTPTEYYKYDQGKAGKMTPWVAEGTTGVYISKDKAPSIFTKGTGSGVSNLLSYSDGKIIGEGVAHIWLSDLIDSDFDCSSAIKHINETYTPGTAAYHNAVKKLREGTFKYVDKNGVEKVQVTPYNHYYLQKDVYEKLPGGLAACDDPETSSCQDAIDYINEHEDKYPKGTEAYHDAVAQVKNKTFSYVRDNEIFEIDASENTNFDYLKRSVYEPAGGIATCKNKGICEFNGANVYLDDCTTGKTFFGDIDDADSWLACEIAYTKDGVIYSSDNTGHEAVETTNGGIVGNEDYCELFCYEEIETRFPTSVTGVKAGQTFTWGSADGTFGTIEVVKKCSTQNYVEGERGYRFKEWEDDYESNEKALIKYYMNKAAYEKAMDDIDVTTDWKYVKCDGCPYTCGTAPNTYSCAKRYMATAEVEEKNKSYYHSYVDTVKGSSEIVSFSTDYEYDSADAAKEAAKTALKEQLQAYADEEYAKYTGRLLKETELLEKIRQCTNNLEYVYETAVRFTFNEPINSVYGANTRNFSFDGNLDVVEDYNKNNVDTSNCIEKTVYSYTCSGTGTSATCAAKKQTVLNCSSVTWNIDGTFTYRYPTDKFQWYSLKTNGTLVNEEKKGTEPEAFFYSIGFGLPTAFSLTNGTYDLKVTVSNLGDSATTKGEQQYNIPDGHFAPLADPVNTIAGNGYGFEYSCTYDVENEVFGYDCQYDENGNLIAESPEYCDSKEDEDSDGSLVGIDITFRLVTLLSDGDSLDKAFPSIDGTGRIPGGNWNIGTNEIKNILDADVYETDQAMYEIMLDVNAIQKIRQDNETYFDAKKDPYTSYIDANGNQKVYCVTGDNQQKYCASTFISKLHEGTGLNYRLLGTCLPTSNTLERAEYILDKGCDTYYSYSSINWTR